MNSLPGVSDEVIEHARASKDVSEDWAVGWCMNDCGEIAFYPPEAKEATEDIGRMWMLVCSDKCLHEVLQRGV